MKLRNGDTSENQGEFQIDGLLSSIAANRQKLIAEVLTLHFLEQRSQTEIGVQLGISTPTVNRLIRQGRELGMLSISINSPYKRLLDLEKKIEQRWSLDRALVVPSLVNDPRFAARNVGEAAAVELRERLDVGQTVALTGGRAIASLIRQIEPDKKNGAIVVPLNGAVQGKHYTDTNFLATKLADKLGGHSVSLHAPLFASSEAECKMIHSLNLVQKIQEQARRADVALVGIGEVVSPNSTYFDMTVFDADLRQSLAVSGIGGTFGAHLVDRHGGIADHDINRRLVSVSPEDICGIPYVIGATFGAEKTGAVISVLKGGYLNCLVVDEVIATSLVTEDFDSAFDKAQTAQPKNKKRSR